MQGSNNLETVESWHCILMNDFGLVDLFDHFAILINCESMKIYASANGRAK